MQGPRSDIEALNLEGFEVEDVICHWEENRSYLYRIRVRYGGKRGDILCYTNPPVHQVGNPGLDAYLEALTAISEDRNALSFVLLSGAHDPVHAGGDLKETLARLDSTLKKKEELAAQGASPDQLYALFSWGDDRLQKGLALYRAIRGLASDMRVVAVCGGGMRYGGSAEIALMADIIVGDSRSGMCFSESQIGLIPGWGGVGRMITKAGVSNAHSLAATSREVRAGDLYDMGVYNIVVDIADPLPRMIRTGDKEKDKLNYAEALQRNNGETTAKLLPPALELAITPLDRIPGKTDDQRKQFAPDDDIAREVLARKTPQNYKELWGKPLKEVTAEMTKLGRPLAPQSIEALTGLFQGIEDGPFDEDAFVEKEMYADASLYRDSRFRSGIVATLEQKVAEFKEE